MNWNVNQVIRHEKNNSAINFYAQLVLVSYEVEAVSKVVIVCTVARNH